jgi:hypothetical protein
MPLLVSRQLLFRVCNFLRDRASTGPLRLRLILILDFRFSILDWENLCLHTFWRSYLHPYFEESI